MKKLFLFIATLGIIANAIAQHTNVLISNENNPEEPSIMVNPLNTNEIIAGANISKYSFSIDGGYTWTDGNLTSAQYGVWGDPCLIVDTAGRYYFFHLSNPPAGEGNWIDRIVCQTTDSINGLWNEGTYTFLDGSKAQDKEWAIVDRTNNNIYVTWTQFDNYGTSNPLDSSIILFSKSTDAGQTWESPKRINDKAGDCVDSDNTVEGAVPAVGPNGEIFVSWAGPEGLMFNKSLDEGTTWLTENIFVSDIPGGWDFNIEGISRCNGLPITACDISNGAYRGNIYINWSDQQNGETDTDIWFSKSTDGGNTWCTPKRVNDDLSNKQQFFTWMCVDQITGYIYFVFYDRRNYDDTQTDVYMAVSKDGGETFINFKISDSPFIPNDLIFFGDYTNISAHNNVIRPIWTRLNNNQLSILTAIIDTTMMGINNKDIAPYFSLEQNTPNPFIDNTYISFKLHKNAVITLYVCDIYGRILATLVNNEKYNSGKYIFSFNASEFNLPSGVYYFSLISNEKMLTRKMLLLK